MSIPAPAKSHIQEHLQRLNDLKAGEAVHYCIVRVSGDKDPDVRASFGVSETATTADAFGRIWKADGDVASSKREDWVVARGVFLASADGLRTLPSVRGNRVTGKAVIKDTLKALRASLKAESLATAPLQKAIDGKIGTMADYTEWARKAGIESKELDDASDMEATADTKSDRVVALVDRFKKVPLREALAAHAAAEDQEALTAAKDELGRILKEIDAISDAGDDARKTLEGRVLGKTRYKSSLGTLDDLASRIRSAQTAAYKAIGATLDGAELLGTDDDDTEDNILKTLRGLLARLKTAPEDARVKLLAEIYFAADYWLKAAGVGSAGREFSDTIDLDMKAQVEEFYTKAATRLAKEAKVSINALPAWLEQHYGKGMERHGTKLDVARGLAKWMSADARDIFRVHIVGGRLYQYPWWTWGEDENALGLEDMKMVPADSAKYPSDQITPGYSGFVLSMGGDVYMTHQHAVAQLDGDQASVFHSSYMAGQPIRMAGELKVVGGAVKVVNPRSGHYRPPRALVVNFLKHMQMLGVKVESVQPDPQKTTTVPVADFLRDHGDEEPDADAYARNEKEMNKYRQDLFFNEMVAAEKALHSRAQGALKTLVQANLDLFETRKAVAAGTATTKQVGQQASLAKAARQAMLKAQPHVDTLTDAIHELDRKLDERAKNHAELTTKDATPVADTADGYVERLTSARDKLKKVLSDIQAAIHEVQNPPAIVVPPKKVKPVSSEESETSEQSSAEEDPLVTKFKNHPAYHGDLDSAGAQRLLASVDGDAWLLRLSTNKGNVLAVSASTVTRGANRVTRKYFHGIVDTVNISMEELEQRYLSVPDQMVRA